MTKSSQRYIRTTPLSPDDILNPVALKAVSSWLACLRGIFGSAADLEGRF
jgi:hypothetical protein